MNLLIIKSRSAKNAGLKEFVRRVTHAGWTTTTMTLEEFLASGSPADAAAPSQSRPTLISHFDDVAIAGGDGTINACLSKTGELPIVVVPLGTGNDLARSLNIHDVGDSARYLRCGYRKKIDLGQVVSWGHSANLQHGNSINDRGHFATLQNNNSPIGERAKLQSDPGRHVANWQNDPAELFANGIGIGLDGVIARKHARGMPYFAAALAAVIQLPRFSGRLIIDDREILRADGSGKREAGSGKVPPPGSRPLGPAPWVPPPGPGSMEFLSITIANGAWSGNGFKTSPAACINDGFLDVVIIRPVTRTTFLRALFSARTGAHITDPSVETYRGRKIVFEAGMSGPMAEIPWHLDGEARASQRLEVTILPEHRQFYTSPG